MDRTFSWAPPASTPVRQSPRPSRFGLAAWLAPAALVCGAGTSFGQATEVFAVYEGARPKAASSFQLKDRGYDRPAGVLHFAVPPTEVGTAGLDREFRSFCAEPLAAVTAGRTYRFEVRRADDPGGFGLPDTADGRKEADRRAGYVRELFGRHYAAAVRGDDPVPAAAFQVALWELTQEAEPPAEGQPFTLSGGTFRGGEGGGAESAAVSAAAEEMLKSLTGSDAVFYEAEATRGTELVRLQGLANLAGEVAQAQFTLRGALAGGGNAPGAGGGGGAGLVGSGLGSGGLGNGFAGLGGGSPGGGGGGLAGGGGGNTNTPPVATTNAPAANTTGTSSTGTNSTATTTTTSTTATSSIGTNSTATTTTTSTTSTTTVSNNTTATDTTDTTTTTNSNDNTNTDSSSTTSTPVPGPPAVVLGLVAMGFIAGRRAFTRAGKR